MAQEIQIYQALIQISVALIAVTITTYSIAISILGTEGFRKGLQAKIDAITKEAEEKLRKGPSFEEARALVSETTPKLQEAKGLFGQLSLNNVVLLPLFCLVLAILLAASGLYYYPDLFYYYLTNPTPISYLNTSAIALVAGLGLLLNALSAIQRAAGQPRPSSLIRDLQPTTAYNEEQLRYRKQLKEEINRLGGELSNTETPNEIPYPVWLCDNKPELRRKLVGNDGEHDVIQQFYTTLQKRYNYQKTMLKPDSEFMRLNNQCIEDLRWVIWLVKF